MNGLQLKGADEEVEPVHGERGTLCDKLSDPEKPKHNHSDERFSEMLLLSLCARRGYPVRSFFHSSSASF